MRGGLIAPTAADVRDVMVEGPSGILETAWKYDTDIRGNPIGIPVYEPSKRTPALDLPAWQRPSICRLRSPQKKG
jgi:hypothetical protein